MYNYKFINGKKFRKGYTTGTCAAAASKAALMALVSQNQISDVDVDTPSGNTLKLQIIDCEFSEKCARCSVVKDGGDDVDVTTGLKVFSEVRVTKEFGIDIKGGEGIGIVTLPGLRVKVGEKAINPVPMKMILYELGKILPDGLGLEVTISVPGGEEVAKKTYNPKLGIEGGISILGTSGIVEPMSEESWKEALELELKVLASRGSKEVVFVFGNYGQDYIINNTAINRDKIVKVSNFIGFMLDKALENKFEKILLAGHIGKLIKVAAGIFHTHSKVADARAEIITAFSALEGAGIEVLEKLYALKTTEAALEIIKKYNLFKVLDRIVLQASARCCEYTYGNIKVGTVLFDSNSNLLAIDESASQILQEMGGI